MLEMIYVDMYFIVSEEMNWSDSVGLLKILLPSASNEGKWIQVILSFEGEVLFGLGWLMMHLDKIYF